MSHLSINCQTGWNYLRSGRAFSFSFLSLLTSLKMGYRWTRYKNPLMTPNDMNRLTSIPPRSCRFRVIHSCSIFPCRREQYNLKSPANDSGVFWSDPPTDKEGRGRVTRGDVADTFILQVWRGYNVLDIRRHGVYIVELKYVNERQTSVWSSISIVMRCSALTAPYIFLWEWNRRRREQISFSPIWDRRWMAQSGVSGMTWSTFCSVISQLASISDSNWTVHIGTW